MEALSLFLLKWGGIIALVVLLAERLARLTSNETDDKVVSFIRKSLRTLGLDFPNIDKVTDKEVN